MAPIGPATNKPTPAPALAPITPTNLPSFSFRYDAVDEFVEPFRDDDDDIVDEEFR
jgi:hypothetical protein